MASLAYPASPIRSTSSPSYEDEEEEEQQRQAQVQAALSQGRHMRQRSSASEQAADDECTPEGPTAGSVPPALPPATSQQLSGWLTLDEPSPGGSAPTVEKKRWCVLMRTFLFLAGTNKDVAHPKGCIDLKGCSVGLARAPSGPGGGGAGEMGSPTGLHLPCAFLISHPRRPSRTFTAPSEEDREVWMRAVQSAIRTPTHVLLSYKGREIFDLEDAQAIEESRQAIRAHVSDQLEKAARQRQDLIDEFARRKAECKALKAQKKTLAASLIKMQTDYQTATSESETLSLQLSQVQMENRSFEKAQRHFFVQLRDLLDAMERSDPNRWNASLTEEDEACLANSPMRRNRQQHAFPESLIEDEPWQIVSSSAARSVTSPPKARNAGRGTLSASGSASSSLGSAFATPIKRGSSASSKSAQHARNQSSGSINGYNGQVISSSYGSSGGGVSSALSPRSKTSGNLGSVDDDEEDDEEELLIESSTLQLEAVRGSLSTLAATPIPAASGSMDGAAPFFLAGSSQGASPGGPASALAAAGIAGSPSLGGSGAAAGGPIAGPGGALLSRTDSNELSEVQSGSLSLLRSSIQLRLEQNTLMKYIAQWLKRKYAIERLRME